MCNKSACYPSIGLIGRDSIQPIRTSPYYHVSDAKQITRIRSLFTSESVRGQRDGSRSGLKVDGYIVLENEPQIETPGPEPGRESKETYEWVYAGNELHLSLVYETQQQSVEELVTENRIVA